jgi:hypothetical protein
MTQQSLGDTAPLERFLEAWNSLVVIATSGKHCGHAAKEIALVDSESTMTGGRRWGPTRIRV